MYEDDDEKYDWATNGHIITTSDAVKISNQRSLKLALSAARYSNGEYVPGANYITSAEPASKYVCERSKRKVMFVPWDESPCENCDELTQLECDRSTLRCVDSDILLLREAPGYYTQDLDTEGEDDSDEDMVEE